MQGCKLLKISWMILAIGTVVGIVVAVVSIINPLFTNGAFEGYTGQSWSEFAEQQPEQAFACLSYSQATVKERSGRGQPY